MAVGRGLMQMDRLSYFPTSTAMVITPPNTAGCGQTINFQITVTNNDGPAFPTPSGIVNILDTDTSSVVGSGSVVSGMANINNASLPSGTGHYQAQYVGLTGGTNNFLASNSTIQSYLVNLLPTTTSITSPASGTSACYVTTINVTGHVSGGATSGTMSFNLWSDNTHFVNLATGTVSGGSASSSVPGGSASAGTYYLQAIFNGSGCYAASSSPSGTAGTPIHLISDVTHATLNAPSTPTICTNQSFTVSGNITGTLFSPPASGTVSIITSSPSVITLATGSVGAGGNFTVTVPANVFPSGATWIFYAQYNGTTCYGSSTSGTQHIKTYNAASSPTATTIASPSNDTLICISQSQSFLINTSYSYPFFGHPNAGTLTLIAYQGGPSITIGSATATGSLINIIVPGNTFPNAGNWFIQAIYSGTACFGASSSTGGTNALVLETFNNTNGPTSTAITAPSSGTYLCRNSVNNFTVTITAGSIATPLPAPNSGTVHLYYASSPFNIFPADWISLGAITPSNGMAVFSVPAGTFPSTGEYFLRAFFNGGSCYGNSGSPGGTSGYNIQIYNSSIATTTVQIDAPGSGSSVCQSASFPLTANVISDLYPNIPNPTSGTITFYYSGNSFAPYPGAWALIGSAAVGAGGFATLNIAPGFFPLGDYFIRARYIDSIGCYGGSDSAGGSSGYNLNITNC